MGSCHMTSVYMCLPSHLNFGAFPEARNILFIMYG